MPWPWVILGRIPRLVPVGAQVEADAQAAAAAAAAAGDEEAELEAEAEHAADFSIPFVWPPRVTVVNAGPTAHPERINPDYYPYILCVAPGWLLLNFGVNPFRGACLDDVPYESNLILLRDFDWAGAEQGDLATATATAERIPPRDGEHAVVSNIESIGIVPTDVESYVIVELMIDQGRDIAKLTYLLASSDKWCQEDTPNPLPDRYRKWVPAGVVAHEDMLWWFDLSWGIISFDPLDGLQPPLLLFHELPEERVLNMALPGIHDHRCITESEGELLFVEIIPDPGRVCMWTRTSDGGDSNATIGWDLEHDLGFEEIWNDDSYIETGLPRKVPLLVTVSPSNSDVVYFVLKEEERLFSVDLLTCTVYEFIDEDYDLVTPWLEPPTCRFVLPWFLPQGIAQALGMDPFDDPGNAEQLVAEIEAAVMEVIHEDDLLQGELHEEEQMAVEIDGVLQEELIHAEEQLLAEVQALNAMEASTDDEEMQEEETHGVELPEAEFHDDDLTSEENLELDKDVTVKMDPATLSRIKSELVEFCRANDEPGPGQDSGDDAGEGAF